MRAQSQRKFSAKEWCLNTLDIFLDRKEIKPGNPKDNQAPIFIGRTDAKAAILWPPDMKKRLIQKDPAAGKDRGQEEKGVTEVEKVAWHHRPN